MILYFADRQMNILASASTELPEGLTISSDWKTEDVETGVSVFECKIPYTIENQLLVKQCAAVGNYILRSANGENDFFTIIDFESDTKKQQFYIYAEDAGLDLLNDVVGAYEADKAYPISHYINMWAAGAGFVIGTNEAANLSRKLSWDGEATVTERLASVATNFDGCEISYSFDVDGLFVVKKYINIYKQRGKDIGITLRLHEDIDSIVTTESISNLATALQCVGGTPEDENLDDDKEPEAITLKGYSYDDGDFYVDGTVLKSREALKRWSRCLWKDAESQKAGGHITKQYSYDTLSQKTLCTHAITELKKLREIEVNYDVQITRLPENAKIGDRVNIVDDAGELYVSTRILKLERSETSNEQKATLGEYLIKGSGIRQKVQELAKQFAINSQSSARALKIANAAKTQAVEANTQAATALADAQAAGSKADEAQAAADAAQEAANLAQSAAENAQVSVETVEKDVESLETTVQNAQAAADQAQEAAGTAQTKAEEAKTAAANAETKAEEAKATAQEAKEAADAVEGTAQEAKTAAEQAQADAQAASTTAAAAKLDAENAQKDIDALGEDLTTLENTMSADYARKTDLTEAQASLQTQITQNASGIASNASQITLIDETANNAKMQAEAAQAASAEAQAQADKAAEDAQAAQTAADSAKTAADNAQAEADTAKTAAATAQEVADKAEADLEAAKADLESVSSRVDATEADIQVAQIAVNTAQEAADKAKADASAAQEKANTAQNTANTAASNAEAAQTAANEAAAKATQAQAAADEAKGDAAKAQSTADEAKAAATEAQTKANTAASEAQAAQSKADEAAATAAAAQTAADDADAKAAQAQADLDTARQNLADVTSRVDATEEEVAAAQQAVQTAQSAADTAKAEAEAAQSAADTAKAEAEAAQSAADTAKATADAAQAAADAAQEAADKAQADVDALAVRVTNAETSISQNSESIKLAATKEEVRQTLGGYYTKNETDAALTVKANEINSNVQQSIAGIQIGGRNLIRHSKKLVVTNNRWTGWTNPSSYTITQEEDGFHSANIATSGATEATYKSMYANVVSASTGDIFTISCLFKVDDEAALDNRKVYIFEVFDEAGLRVQWDDCSLDRSLTETLEDGKWVKLVSHHTVSYEGENLNCGLRLCLFQNGSIHFKQFKMEIGNKATDWTPAPEDMASVEELNALGARVSTAETNVSQNAEAIELRATKTEVTAAVDAVEVGGRNLLSNSSFSQNFENWENVGAEIVELDGVQCAHIAGQLTYGYRVYQSILDKIDSNDLSQQYVFSADVRIDDWVAGSTNPLLRLYVDGYRDVDGVSTWFAPETVYGSPNFQDRSGDGWVRAVWSFTIPYVTDTLLLYIYARDFTGDLYFKNLKFEKGTKATDWTPAPEDVDGSISSMGESLQNVIKEQSSQLLIDAEGITLAHLEGYVKDDDEYKSFKEGTETQLSLLDGKIDMKFGAVSENVDELSTTQAERFAEIYKHISFSDTGIMISSGDSSIRLRLDNEGGIVFEKKGDGDVYEAFGTWDGTDFHTGNIVVKLNERAQFGNFAWVPRDDGSLAFVKVGG